MVTKELGNSKVCVFCASDYHLEMILLPYIKTRIDTNKFIILTQTDLEPTLKKLLDRVTLDDKFKQKVWNLNWKEKRLDKIEDFFCNEQNIAIIINGECNYIKAVNQYINKNNKRNLSIIDCFHVSDSSVDIDELKGKYDYMLNTRKL